MNLGITMFNGPKRQPKIYPKLQSEKNIFTIIVKNKCFCQFFTYYPFYTYSRLQYESNKSSLSYPLRLKESFNTVFSKLMSIQCSGKCWLKFLHLISVNVDFEELYVIIHLSIVWTKLCLNSLQASEFFESSWNLE